VCQPRVLRVRAHQAQDRAAKPAAHAGSEGEGGSGRGSRLHYFHNGPSDRLDTSCGAPRIFVDLRRRRATSARAAAAGRNRSNLQSCPEETRHFVPLRSGGLCATTVSSLDCVAASSSPSSLPVTPGTLSHASDSRARSWLLGDPIRNQKQRRDDAPMQLAPIILTGFYVPINLAFERATDVR
jgi:hypothetical protein